MTQPQVDVTADSDGGVLKALVKAGLPGDAHRPLQGDRVHVHYVGTLEDGSKFDSSRDRGQPFSFTLGKGEVIKGWDIGVATMQKNETAVFTIKSQYGYGDTGSPPRIPGGATLIFEVELIEFEGEDVTKDKDKGVTKRIIKAGEGFDHPNEESQLEIHFKASTENGTVFDDKELSFILGEGIEHGLPHGVETGLLKMKKNETALLTISPKYGFGSEGNSAKSVPANAKLTYEVTLKSFERAKESWQLDGAEKLEQARLFKESGTNFFKQGKFELALRKYKRIIDLLEHEISLKGDDENERKSLLQAGRLNVAMCYLKMKDWIEARNTCDKIIDENEKCEKAFFRRGEAHLNLRDFDLARADFLVVLQLEPENQAAKAKAALCSQEIKKQKEREKKTFANMFDRFAKLDAKREPESTVEINDWEDKAAGKDTEDAKLDM